jgi:hypothetical protein
VSYYPYNKSKYHSAQKEFLDHQFLLGQMSIVEDLPETAEHQNDRYSDDNALFPRLQAETPMNIDLDFDFDGEPETPSSPNSKYLL